MNDPVESLLGGFPELYVSQRKELVEILVDWETSNRYVLLGPNQQQIGYVAERKRGIWAKILRGFFRSHRGFEVDIFNPARQPIMHLARAFFWIFSDLEVTRMDGRRLGNVRRRFGILYKKYDLEDEGGRIFARVESPLWRLWEFPVLNSNEQQVATISKRWGGMLREIFTDADTYRIDFGAQSWTPAQRAVLLAAAISIDFDFFENNSGSRGGLLRKVDSE